MKKNPTLRVLLRRSAQRLWSQLLWSDEHGCRYWTQDLYGRRQRIESGFGGLTSAGLGPLPPWVRGPRRVALWTAGKVLLYLCRCAVNKGLMA